MTIWKVGLLIAPALILTIAFALHRKGALSRAGLTIVSAFVLASAAVLLST
jgi:hypothetical protein